jgi:hypothetical protein
MEQYGKSGYVCWDGFKYIVVEKPLPGLKIVAIKSGWVFTPVQNTQK